MGRATVEVASLRGPGLKPHFELFGIPVRVEPTFFLIVLIVALTPGITPLLMVSWVVIVFVSILVHELGHAFAFRAFGESPAILLHSFGGATMGSGARRSKRESIIISLAGPLSAVAVLGVPALLMRNSDWATQSIDRENIVNMVVWVNVGWSIFNLLPILPLDGGHVAEELAGRKAAHVISIVVAIPIIVWALSMGFVFAAMIVGFLAFQNWTALRQTERGGARVRVIMPTPESQRRAAAGAPVATTVSDPRIDALPEPWREASTALGAGDITTAMRTLERAFLAEPPPQLFISQQIADSGVATRLAQRLLTGDDPGLRGATELQHHLQYAGRPAAAALVGERLAADPRVDRAQVAFDIGRSWSSAGEIDRALTWLSDAIDHGFRQSVVLDGEPDLAPARAHHGWRALRARLP